MAGECDVGVLFVHGIGEQKRGETIGVWSDAVIEWLRGWLGPDAVTVDAVHLKNDPADPDAPAFVDLTVSLIEEGGGRSSVRWRLAEAWWADAFLPPRFGELATWAFGIIPYAVSAHYTAKVKRAWNKGPAGGGGLLTASMPVRERIGLLSGRARRLTRCVPSLLALTLSMAVAPFVAVLAFLLLVAAALPIARIRALALAGQRVLSRSVGDSFVLLGSETRAGAIVHQVEHDLSWLGGNSTSVVVVAHSQGAEVAHRAVRRRRPARVHRLVTLGSGQTKLASLSSLRTTKAHRTVLLGSTGVVLFIASVAETMSRLRSSEDEPFVALVVAFFALALMVTGALEAQIRAPGPDALETGADDGWLDLYASHDPVSNGPLFGLKDVDGIEEREVSNRGSLSRDHTAYAQNAEQVVAAIVATAAAAGHRTILGSDLDLAALRLATHRRDWRVRWLKPLRAFAIAATAMVVVLVWEELGDIGLQVVEAATTLLAHLPFVELQIPGQVQEEGLSPVAGAMVIVAAALVSYAVVARAWHIWHRVDSERMFTRRGYPLWSAEFVALLWLAIGLPAAAVWLSVGDVQFDVSEVATWEAASLPLAFFLLTVFLAGALAPLVTLLQQVGVVRAGHYPGKSQELAAVLVPAAVLFLVAIAAGLPDNSPAMFWLVLVVGVPVFALLGPAVLTSSRRVRKGLRPLRRWAHADWLPLSAEPLLSREEADRALTDYGEVLTELVTRQVDKWEGRGGEMTRDLDDLALEACDIARALNARSLVDSAEVLLAAAARVDVDAALALYELRPDDRATALLEARLTTAPWRDRRRIRSAMADTTAGANPIRP